MVELEGSAEAMYEAAAVNYAAEKTGLGCPNLQLAAGGGSINMVYEHRPFNIECGFRKGMKKLMEEGLSAVKFCEDEAIRNIDAFVAEFSGDFQEPIEGTVIAISACYYAAKASGLVKEEAVTVKEVLNVFGARMALLLDTAIEVEGQITDKKMAQEISNLILQSEVFKRLTHPDTNVYFRRDWEIHGIPFRTTWTVGCFLKSYIRTEADKVKYYPWAEEGDKEAALDTFNASMLPKNNTGHHRSFARSHTFKADHWGTAHDDGGNLHV